MTIGAIVDLIYLGILAYYFFFMPDPAKRLEGFTSSTIWLIVDHLGARHRLVLLLEAAEQGRRRGHVHDLRRVAA